MKTNWKLLTQMVGILRNKGHTLQFPREPGLLQGCEHTTSWAATTQTAGWYAPGPGTEPTGQVSLSVLRMTLDSWQPSNNKKRGQTCSGGRTEPRPVCLQETLCFGVNECLISFKPQISKHMACLLLKPFAVIISGKRNNSFSVTQWFW